jgi:tuftelin-interacting protein 11
MATELTCCSTRSNHWDATDPTDAINLFTAWKSLLPLFLRDNILDQLILPKVMKAIQEWSPAAARRGGASLHAIVFPWLEHVGARSGIVLDEAKRKVRAWLKGWKATEGVPADLEIWKDVGLKNGTTVDLSR